MLGECLNDPDCLSLVKGKLEGVCNILDDVPKNIEEKTDQRDGSYNAILPLWKTQIDKACKDLLEVSHALNAWLIQCKQE